MRVTVVGVGMTRFTRYSARTAEDLAAEAVMGAVRSAGIDHREIGAAFVGSLYEPQGAGQRLLKDVGIHSIPISNVENACATGTDAFIQAVNAVRSGDVQYALALGVDTPTTIASNGLLPITQGDPSLSLGLTAPAVYALRATRYLHEAGATPADLAAVTVKSRQHAATNPVALYRDPVTLQQVLNSPMISTPLTRLQSCPISDGAAAVVVGPATGQALAEVRGWAMRSGSPQYVVGTDDDITRRTATAAYEMAGVGPEEVQLGEVHDAFTIGEVLALEGLSLCRPLEGAAYVAAGRATLGGGGVVVNPSGGMLARGHPPGATGLAQVVEVCCQFAGTVGVRQVEDASVAVCHTRGGGSFDLDANACGVVVLTRPNIRGAFR